MKKIGKSIFFIVLLVMIMLYALTSYVHFGVPETYWAWRKELIMASGMALMLSMGGCMLLAARFGFVERALGGLDKLYALHKTMGISAGVFLSIHWLLKLSPKLVMAMEWAAPKVKGPKGPKDPLVSLAKDLGEWAAWFILIMVVAALLRMIPYRFWRYTHKLFIPLYLIGVFHGVMLIHKEMWFEPVGWILTLSYVIGSVCALYALFGMIGKNRTYLGKIAEITKLPGGQIEVACHMENSWPGHQAGQFALVNFGKGEGAHPFTIACADKGIHSLRFVIKALGDYTARLPNLLQVGQMVKIEGPYGGFNLHSGVKRQAWVAGGIGVTPFLAWLESNTLESTPLDVDFYYCVKNKREAVRLDEITAICKARNVRLHLIESEAGARLDASLLPDVKDVWFCGPAGLGKALQDGLRQQGRGLTRFHHEAFSMR